ncbi:TlpA family protein disulfide reductase [Hirschia baltica]|uniref:Redoxin domain protein n=1 Tax=Hirschia baltica (strain ATCC 49814 / DSM 5838 / IFAM 1418) TaxID=582402 RepID=C6XLN6_HIRBI|nr:TlpA disulfide reductase family protein [Hirschia baltica]ACT57942.1 Redoxin domain protein [Hirschia baltica ATCC 49814]
MPKAITRFGIPAMLIVGGLFVVVALFSASNQPKTGSSGLKRYAKGDLASLELSAGKAAPSGEFDNAEGKAVSLQDFNGEVVVLNIWFEACPPCEEEMPSLGRLQEAVQDDGVRVVAVAVDREYNRENTRKSLEQWTNGVLDFYFDTTYGIAYDTGAKGMPTTIIYNRNGEEVARFSGGADWSSENAIALIKEIASTK